ncbi:MAG TPA: class I adenylate-forming enzyme family protein [Nocardioidaceae bacterium]|nr:class I adenylate-forming enzyme family protein [Nocardioidaceae bacterium]
MTGLRLVRLSPGDRVALLVPGSVAYVETVIGLLASGIIPVPMDPKLTQAERDRLVPYVEPSLTVTDEEALRELHSRFGSRDGLPLARPMHLTSGTTGAPKGVYSGVLDPGAAETLLREERELWGFSADDTNLVLSPMHHSAPLRFAMGTLLAGGRVVVPGAFDVAAATAAIERERPTTMFCVPTHLQRLFAYWDEVGAPDLTCFRLVAHAGAACPPALKHRVIEAFPERTTWEFYGSTEGQFTACRSEEWLEHPGSVGRARPGRTLSVDADGTIWASVPEHARFSYWRAPEKTDAAWRGDAFTVGDLGRLDEKGYLYLDGRREDLVISGGVNVYPVEVENVLATCPGVREIAVFGVPDDEWGQRVCAAVVGDVDLDELRALAKQQLAPAKRPKDYVRLDALPHTATGKVKRLELSSLLPRPAGSRTSGGTAAG